MREKCRIFASSVDMKYQYAKNVEKHKGWSMSNTRSNISELVSTDDVWYQKSATSTYRLSVIWK